MIIIVFKWIGLKDIVPFFISVVNDGFGFKKTGPKKRRIEGQRGQEASAEGAIFFSEGKSIFPAFNYQLTWWRYIHTLRYPCNITCVSVTVIYIPLNVMSGVLGGTQFEQFKLGFTQLCCPNARRFSIVSAVLTEVQL